MSAPDTPEPVSFSPLALVAFDLLDEIMARRAEVVLAAARHADQKPASEWGYNPATRQWVPKPPELKG